MTVEDLIEKLKEYPEDAEIRLKIHFQGRDSGEFNFIYEEANNRLIIIERVS